MGEFVISCDKLCKKYGNRFAVYNASFNVEKGEILGLVGKNGAGKTTLIRLLTGISNPTSGTFKLFGKDQKELSSVLANVSTMIEHPAIYENMTAKDNLLTQCILRGVKDPLSSGYIQTRLSEVGLDYLFDSPKKAGLFSLGMKQRLGIAMATIGEPELMILDEPTNGLDPEGIIQIRNLLLKLNKEKNVTILISSHILSELSKFATSYLFIDKGHLREQITADHLEKSKKTITIQTLDNEKTISLLTEKEYKFTTQDNDIVITTSDDQVNVLNLLIQNSIQLNKFEYVNESVEDYFIHMLGD